MIALIALSLSFFAAQPTLAQPPEDNPRAAVLVQQAAGQIRNHDFSKAQDALIEAKGLNPKQRGLWITYAALFSSTNRADMAIASVQTEIDNYPGQPELYRLLARTQLSNKRTDDAISTLRELLKIAPLDPEGLHDLARLLLNVKRFDEAMDLAGQAVAAFPTNADFQVLRAEALLRAGYKEEGVAAARAMAGYSLTPPMLNNVAVALTDTGADIPLAVDFADRSVKSFEDELKNLNLSTLTPSQITDISYLANSWDNDGWARFRSGDIDGGLKYVEAAWRLGQFAVAGDHLGQILDRKGNRAEAIHVWQLTLATSSKQPDVAERLRKLAPPEPVRPSGHSIVVSPAEEVSKMRNVAIPGFSRPKGSAEFFVLLSANGVEDVSFISGAEDLRAAKDQIAKAHFDVSFPDAGPEKITRRGILSCSQYTTPNCQLVLLLPSNTKVP